MVKLYLCVFVSMIICISACTNNYNSIQTTPVQVSLPKEFDLRTSYPYCSEEDLPTRVESNLHLIKAGISYSDILLILGKPTCLSWIYPPIIYSKRPLKPVGFRMWYIFKQNSDSGSWLNKGMVGYTIDFKADFSFWELSKL